MIKKYASYIGEKMTTKEQHEQNLAGFINLLKTSMSDVDSFKKGDISTYFLMMRKFFKNYINENNEKYDAESPLCINGQEEENIKYFFNTMIEIFEKSQSVGFIHEMTVVDSEKLKEITNCQFSQMDAIQTNLKIQHEIVCSHNHKIESLLKEIGVTR